MKDSLHDFITKIFTQIKNNFGNVDNTSDADKPISKAQQAEFDKLNNNLSILETNLGDLKENFDEKNMNLLVPSYLLEHCYREYTSGIKRTLDNYNTYDMVPVEPNTRYVRGIAACHFSFYDSNKQYIGGFEGPNIVYTNVRYPQAYCKNTFFTTPEDCRYIAYSYDVVYEGQICLYKADKLPTYIEDFGSKTMLSLDKIINLPSDIKIISNENLLDKHRVTVAGLGLYVEGNDGKIGTTNNNEFGIYVLEVEPNTTYTTYNFEANHNIFYDKDFTAIGTKVVYGGDATVTSPANAKYWVVTVKISRLNNMAICKGNKATYGMIGSGKVYGIQYGEKIVTVGSSGCDYTNLLEALVTEGKNTTFKLKNEVYDVKEMYESYYGSSYFDNYTGYSKLEDAGLPLKYGCKLIGSSNTVLRFLSESSSTSVKQNFSIIASTLGNTIQNITFEFTDDSIRYAIHDDFASWSGVSMNGENVIKNCIFKGTPNQDGIIGGGMGFVCNYEISDCVFLGGTSKPSITYHNSHSDQAQNHITIKNCYATSKIRLYQYGSSTKESIAIVNNCIATGIDCIPHPYVSSGNENANITMYAWNNTII